MNRYEIEIGQKLRRAKMVSFLSLDFGVCVLPGAKVGSQVQYLAWDMAQACTTMVQDTKWLLVRLSDGNFRNY